MAVQNVSAAASGSVHHAPRRFVIVVGLPKSGTTYLHAQCARRSDLFAMPLRHKEVDYFRRGADRHTYLGHFDPDPDKTVFDASPLYLDNVVMAVSNMKTALAGDQVRIVVCLRDPMERVYSHYLHDVAQNQKILGHADYSFWSPPVLAKYLHSVAPRVRYLQEAFGHENVLGFAFGNDMSRLEDELRTFVGLERDWRLDFKDNPAPGFTAPRAYYDHAEDMEVPLSGGRYLLSKGQLLIVNRQFSILRSDIRQAVAERILMRQSSLTLQFDPGQLEEETRDRIFDDMDDAARLVGLSAVSKRGPRVMHAKLSDSVANHILAQMPRLGSLDQVISRMMDSGLQQAAQTVVEMPVTGPSLARELARISLRHAGDGGETGSIEVLRRGIIDRFGPIPLHVEALMHWFVARRRYDEALALLDECGGSDGMLWPVDLAWFLASHQITLPDEVAARFRKAGVRLRLPG